LAGFFDQILNFDEVRGIQEQMDRKAGEIPPCLMDFEMDLPAIAFQIAAHSIHSNPAS
jgi:hypothetical protein